MPNRLEKHRVQDKLRYDKNKLIKDECGGRPWQALSMSNED